MSSWAQTNRGEKNMVWFGEIERKLAKLSVATFTYRPFFLLIILWCMYIDWLFVSQLQLQTVLKNYCSLFNAEMPFPGAELQAESSVGDNNINNDDHHTQTNSKSCPHHNHFSSQRWKGEL